MKLTEYQFLAQRTSKPKSDEARIDNGCKGLCGETGELIDILKKHDHQGHPLNRPHMIEELGDVLWYCAELATGLGITLDEVAQLNIDKLKSRYPEGFAADASMDRPQWVPDDRD